jgi:hypothetical protein
VGVFGLSLYTTERQLEKEFGRYAKAVVGISPSLKF